MKRLTKKIPFSDGTCIYDFSNERVGEFLTDHKGGVRALFEELSKYEDIAEQGYVTESNMVHKRITYMKPIKHDYSDKDHPNYFKYSCPVCDMLGNKHQVHKGESNCMLCGVNLLWQ